MSGLAEHLTGWWPDPVRHTDRIRQWPVAAFAGLLDQPAPAEGDPLPPMWHWFSFLEHPAHSELGSDGHPAAGHFLPPIPHRRRMFAGGRWQSHSALRVGDEVTRSAQVTSIEPKTGRSGEMAFVTIRYEYSRAGELAAVEEQDIVYRSDPPRDPAEATTETPDPAPAATTEAPAPAPADPGADDPGADDPPAEHELRIVPDPQLLFRFSALTYNAHRIHYDQPYATAVEGYPGLVVHGPLLALLALELPRRAGIGVEEFRYRLRRPAFVGAPIVSRGWAPDAEGRSELAVGEQGRPASLTATARFGEAA
jgi:3-methylfumaryl-CoA hydratase